MPVLIFRSTSDLELHDLVARACVHNPAPALADIIFDRYPGPPLAGLSTRWWKWTLQDEKASLVLQTDDGQYPSSSGLIARPEGSSTSYLAADDAAKPVGRRSLAQAVMEVANSESTAPLPDARSPISEEIMTLRHELAKALSAEKPRWNMGKYDVSASQAGWVEVDIGGCNVLVELKDEGIHLGFITAVYVSATADSGEDPVEFAKDYTISELEPRLHEIGFRRDNGDAFTGADDAYDGADVVGWNLTVQDVYAAAQAIKSLSAIDTTVEVTIQEGSIRIDVL